ncbi:GspH/FimT family pseudopilin [Agaribacterium haliotis]|uniref:GspH/FimT family pseudopilin n=1 Tax=Agaribacterium haliotis TaxID=2013869 RepID=UPI000BB5817F|nr:GspH/FimT family pseudopilin [Agaribacterium haliotis]
MPKQQGLTVLNLVFSLSIVAILCGIAVPNMNHFVQKKRADYALNLIAVELNYARSHAINSRQHTIVCPSKDQQKCNNDWNLDRMVFVDSNQNEVRDEHESLLSLHKGLSSQHRVRWRSFGNKAFVRFDLRGSTLFQSGRFYWCNDTETIKRQLIVYRSGRIRKVAESQLQASCG